MEIILRSIGLIGDSTFLLGKPLTVSKVVLARTDSPGPEGTEVYKCQLYNNNITHTTLNSDISTKSRNSKYVTCLANIDSINTFYHSRRIRDKNSTHCTIDLLKNKLSNWW